MTFTCFDAVAIAVAIRFARITAGRARWREGVASG